MHLVRCSALLIALFLLNASDAVGQTAAPAADTEMVAAAGGSQSLYLSAGDPVTRRALRANRMIASAAFRPASFANLGTYVNSHLTYPELAQKNYREGEVRLRLHLSAEGHVQKATVVDGLGLGCDEAAVQLAMAMPAWTPATRHGVPVESMADLAIHFRLR